MSRKLTFLIGGLVGAIALVLLAATPSFQSFNTNQFGTNAAGTQISIKSGVLLTNIAVSGMTNTNNAVFRLEDNTSFQIVNKSNVILLDVQYTTPGKYFLNIGGGTNAIAAAALKDVRYHLESNYFIDHFQQYNTLFVREVGNSVSRVGIVGGLYTNRYPTIFSVPISAGAPSQLSVWSFDGTISPVHIESQMEFENNGLDANADPFFPLCLVGTAAGSGATVSVTGADVAQKITLTTGTGATAGVLFTNAFARNYTLTPTVVLTAANTNAAVNSPAIYVSSTSVSNYVVSAATVPTSSIIFIYHAHVIQ